MTGTLRAGTAIDAVAVDDYWPLAHLNGVSPIAPRWFDAARAVDYERHLIQVEECAIEMLCWGERGKPGMLLMHGSMAHAAWWLAVAPLLAQDMRVCAMSFSGMGGSGRRERYSTRMMAREAWAAAGASGLFDAPVPPVVAAHSFGGKAGALLACDKGDSLLGMIFVDSFVLPKNELGRAPPFRPRSYPTEAEALARFRFAPDQPPGDLAIVSAVARAGILQMPDGNWTWAFDPDLFRKFDFQSGWEEAIAARCPLAFLRAEHSAVVSPQDAEAQRRAMRPDSIFVEIPDAYHHIMIDQPLALVAAVRSICAGWAAGKLNRLGAARAQGQEGRMP